jgi:hypothetical protein
LQQLLVRTYRRTRKKVPSCDDSAALFTKAHRAHNELRDATRSPRKRLVPLMSKVFSLKEKGIGVRFKVLFAGVIAASIAAPLAAQAQGVPGGVAHGASEGWRIAGPVGAVVGAPVGGIIGGVEGLLGVQPAHLRVQPELAPQRTYRRSAKKPRRHASRTRTVR